MATSPCARHLVGQVERREQRRRLDGQAVCSRDQDLGSARVGQGKTGGREAFAALGGQRVDRDKLTNVLGFAFPTIALLPGADKDLPARFGLPKMPPNTSP